MALPATGDWGEDPGGHVYPGALYSECDTVNGGVLCLRGWQGLYTQCPRILPSAPRAGTTWDAGQRRQLAGNPTGVLGAGPAACAPSLLGEEVWPPGVTSSPGRGRERASTTGHSGGSVTFALWK